MWSAGRECLAVVWQVRQCSAAESGNWWTVLTFLGTDHTQTVAKPCTHLPATRAAVYKRIKTVSRRLRCYSINSYPIQLLHSVHSISLSYYIRCFVPCVSQWRLCSGGPLLSSARCTLAIWPRLKGMEEKGKQNNKYQAHNLLNLKSLNFYELPDVFFWFIMHSSFFLS